MSVETITEKHTVKARKEHKCSWCGLAIDKGEKYSYTVYKFDGQIYSWKNHIDCEHVAWDLNMFDDCDDGVTDSDFREFVWTYFRDNHPEADKLNDEMEWKDVLEWVKNDGKE